MLSLSQLIAMSAVPATASEPIFVAASKCRFDSVTFANISGGAVDLTVYVVPEGEQPANAYALIQSQSIPSHEGLHPKELIGKVLIEGDQIYAVASSANALNVLAGGVSET